MKCANSNRGGAGQVAVGMIVIALGVLFLLDNFDIIAFGDAISFWPTLLIIFGVIKLSDSQVPGGRLLGAALLGAGVLMTLSRVGLFDFAWRMLWPLILIFVGGSVVLRAIRTRHAPAGMKDDMGASDDVIDATAILGGFQRRLTTAHFGGGDITAIMGGCSIDLRDCSLDGEAVINVFAFMGGITLKCPADWTVILSGTPFMGGFEEKTARPPDNSKRLVVKGYAFMGGVDVRN